MCPPGPRQRFLLRLLLIGCLLRPVGGALQAQPSEAAVKAGFVYNFAKFTEWPASAPGGHQLTLCLVAADASGLVAQAIEGRSVQGRTMTVHRPARADEWRSCHIVYFTEVDERRQSEVLRLIRGLPVLTIGDADGFAEVGGVIGLVASAGRIQFEINAEVAQQSSLKLSSQLLRLARAIRGRQP
ncbi:uncharacterized protein DUF4154 [Sphaerotilus hippei]|uniref:Uncharacterized protein DUF4154 n=1 Tax=Sphaerotilus hippei TaxID=744406 RepID=A0A318GY02_9BURK|nr:YfiR family protein [Sphaerotilus hippei]PXW93420.1 uncharacterized protein DUF4154 [Sphaerotilus hippei]